MAKRYIHVYWTIAARVENSTLLLDREYKNTSPGAGRSTTRGDLYRLQQGSRVFCTKCSERSLIIRYRDLSQPASILKNEQDPKVQKDHGISKNNKASVLWKGIDRMRQETSRQVEFNMSPKGAPHELCIAEAAQKEHRPHGIKALDDTLKHAKGTEYARAFLETKKTRNQLVVCTPRH
ncbi:MAG: hypothetical protein J3Q66DRAFT_408971 [Benniella sp.]|nr:MAG: hypothetical protein J3Q66DRAFT_408971 [Benniella sp.]